MTIKQIYELAIQLGMKADLRGEATVRRKLKKNQEKFKKLNAEEKKEFDQESLTNPYADTRLFATNPNQAVKRILTGIDIEASEVLLAKQLSTDKKPIDLIISHHPIGKALAGLHEVTEMQAEILALYGLPINVAQSLQAVRTEEVSRKLNPINHNQVLDAARLLNFPILCVHTATDNLVADFIKKALAKNKKNLETVGDVLNLLKKIPEYSQAIHDKAGPRLFAGREENFTGKIAITEVTGGTEGNKEIYAQFSNAGVGTVIGMHMSEEHKKEAEKYHVNAIVAGHISSDSIGMNFFLDQLEKRGIEIIPAGGLIRVKRFGKKS